MSLDMFPKAIALAVALVACVTDIRTRRIPNLLTFGAAALAFMFHLFIEGWTAGGTSVLAWLVGLLVFLPFFLVGGLGAGDVKLVAAIGAWLGSPALTMWVALYTGIAGGVMALMVMLVRGYAKTTFNNLRLMITSWRLGVATVPGLTLDETTGPKLAYAIPIAVGTGLTLWLR
jgi:prepilin peptidase CpaA